MEKEQIKGILKRCNIKYILALVGVSLLVGVGYAGIQFGIMTSIIENHPERLLSVIAEEYGYTSDLSRIQLLERYREGSYEIGYQIQDILIDKSIQALILGVFMGIILMLLYKFFRRYMLIGIGVVVLVGIISSMHIYMIEPINFVEIQERIEQLAREEARIKEEERKRKETDPTTFTATFRTCDMEQIQKLVEGYELGADVADDEGNTALAVVSSMLAYHPDAGDVVKYLLEKGADPNVMYEGASALYYAAVADDDCVEDLLLAGANPNYTNDNGDTPLRAAVDEYAIGAVGHLLYHGADVNKPGKGGETPYNLALERLDYDSTYALYIFEQIYSYYPGVGVRLHKYYGDTDKLSTLIEVGVNINEMDSLTGDTLLHRAAKDLDMTLCEILLQNGIDATLLNLEGRTAREVIGQNKYHIEYEEQKKMEELFDTYQVEGNTVDIILTIDERLNLAPQLERELIEILRSWYETFTVGEIEAMLVLEPTESIYHRGRIGLVFDSMKEKLEDWDMEIERLKTMINESSLGMLIYIDKDTGEEL